jgi:hypothetical protein
VLRRDASGALHEAATETLVLAEHEERDVAVAGLENPLRVSAVMPDDRKVVLRLAQGKDGAPLYVRTGDRETVGLRLAEGPLVAVGLHDLLAESPPPGDEAALVLLVTPAIEAGSTTRPTERPAESAGR